MQGIAFNLSHPIINDILWSSACGKFKSALTWVWSGAQASCNAASMITMAVCWCCHYSCLIDEQSRDAQIIRCAALARQPAQSHRSEYSSSRSTLPVSATRPVVNTALRETMAILLASERYHNKSQPRTHRQMSYRLNDTLYTSMNGKKQNRQPPPSADKKDNVITDRRQTNNFRKLFRM